MPTPSTIIDSRAAKFWEFVYSTEGHYRRYRPQTGNPAILQDQHERSYYTRPKRYNNLSVPTSFRLSASMNFEQAVYLALTFDLRELA